MVQFIAWAFQHRCCCTIPTPSVFLSFCLSVFLSFCFSVFLSFCFSVRIVQFIARAFQHLCCTIPTPSGNCRQARHQQTSSPPFIGEIINYSAKVHLNWKGFKSDHFVVETTLAESGQFLSNRLNIKTGFMMWTKLFTWTWYLLYTSIKRGFRNIVWEEHIYKCRSVFWALLK